MAHRVTAPVDFRGLDEAVHDSGAPSSSWLGRELAQRGRWLDAHLRRSMCISYPQGQVVNGVTPDSLMQVTAPTMLGPFIFDGTPGCSLLGGEWYLRAKIAALRICRALPYVSQPALLPPRILGEQGGHGELEMTGTGAWVNYGPMLTPLAERAQQLGVLLSPEGTAGTDLDNDVYFAHFCTVVSAGADFAALTPPYPSIRLLNAAGDPISQWSEIRAIGQTFVGGDTATLATAVTHPFVSYDANDGITWEARDVYGAMYVGSLMLREKTP